MIYQPKGVCSNTIDVQVEDGVIKSVKFTGGCNGNLQAVRSLVDGLTVEQIEKKVRGIMCGMKGTSCPDQLAKAVREAYEHIHA